MTLTQVPHVCVLLTLLGLYSFRSAAELELVEQRAPELTCSEGLVDCHVSSVSPFSGPFPDTDDTVNVIHVHLKVILCCSARQDCEPCLQILIEFQEADKAHQVSAGSGDSSDEEGSSRFVPIAVVKVCLSTPGTSEIWKTIQFKLNYSSLKQAPKNPTHKVLLTEKVMFGIPIVVQVDTQSYGVYDIANITVPSLEEVCSMNLEDVVKECDVPKLRVVTDPKRDVVLLQLENTDASQEEIMCQMIWNGMPGEVLAWPKGKREMTVPASIVVPCLCFQVWWERKSLRRELCPFKNQHDVLEKMRNNVSVSVAECQMRDGGMGLIWNVTAPCSLEAEVWLCKKDLPGGQCKEVTGSKQILHNHLHSGWHATRNGHWRAGEFNVSSHPILCVQIKIHGMKSHLEPQCPFATFRWRWSLPLGIGLLLVCLAILGAYFMQGVLQGYVWRWLKEGDVRGAVGGGHVVLLYPPDDDQALPELMCHLGLSLQNLGFSVSLDMWSQGELSVLGPVPWLHSRLNQLKRHGGKVVLVLTPATWRRAEEWWAESWEKNRDRNSNMKEEEAGRSYTTSSACADIFTASLSCIVADHLQGCAGERFMMVQFESHPPEPPGVFSPLPELFRGLRVYSLPSQSLGFLTELAGARPMATASTRRKRAWGLRMASRSLAQGLSAFTVGTTVLHLSRGSHSHVGVGVEDSTETVPFQPCMGVIRPPSSTDTNPKVGEKDWV